MNLQQNTYDQYADEYVAMLQKWAQDGSLYHDLVIPQVLEFLGDVAGRTVLDAGCGEGYVARLLTSRGASVTAVDVSERLVQLAKAQDRSGSVRYVVQDLSKGFAPVKGSPDGQLFDLVVSNFVLNDVYDYSGYINTLGQVTKAESRIVLTFNNPYSAVVRAKAQNYFDSGAAVPYEGLGKMGVRVYHFHRTFEEYMSAFYQAGFLLRRLSDLGGTEKLRAKLNVHERPMPYVIVLELVKVQGHAMLPEAPEWQ